jgi:hypothetical protein
MSNDHNLRTPRDLRSLRTLRNLRILLAASLALLLSTGAASAADPAPTPPPVGGEILPSPDTLSILLDSIRANRKALLAVNLGLGKEEAAKFWPLYEKYQGALNPIGDRQAAIIDDYITHYRDLSNDRAVELVNDYLETEADRIEVRRKFVKKFAKILPGRTVGRFYQIENKMDAVIRYELASTIPVVEPSAAPAE